MARRQAFSDNGYPKRNASFTVSGWEAFWEENERCFVPFSTAKLRVPVLVELGDDWILNKMGANYRRYYLDFDYQQEVRQACAAEVRKAIGLILKPKVDSASLLHGSIYGGEIVYPEDSTPWLKPVIHSEADIRPLIERMERTDPLQAGIVPWFLGCYAKLGVPYRWRILHDPTAVHGPATIAGFLCGITEFMMFLYDVPDLMQELMSLIARVTVSYSKAMRQHTGAPSTGVGLFDDVAGLLSPRLFERFCLPVYQYIFTELARGPDDERFVHNDANVAHLLPFLNDLGVTGINPDPVTDPLEIRRQMPRTVIYGCVPPLLLKDGTPEEVLASARRSIEMLGGDGGLVLTAAGSINLGTPYENIQALCEAADQYGRYEDGQLAARPSLQRQ